MSKTIIQLFNGELEPVRYWGMAVPEIRQLELLIQRNFEKLTEYLSDREKEILEKYCDAVNEYITIVSERTFQNGFCLGIRLMAEALTSLEASP